MSRHVTRVCNRETEANKKTINDWGFSFTVDSELTAFRIAYAYRDNPHGVKVEFLKSSPQYMVTVFNAFGASIGMNH